MVNSLIGSIRLGRNSEGTPDHLEDYRYVKGNDDSTNTRSSHVETFFNSLQSAKTIWIKVSRRSPTLSNQKSGTSYFHASNNTIFTVISVRKMTISESCLKG
jgi:hypothetical protein